MYIQSTFKKNGKRWGKKFKDDRDWSKYNEELVIRGEFYLDLSFRDEWFRAVYRKISPELKERVITHTSVTRNDSLDEFRNSGEPKVLFAIKMEEGTDFRDEQARWSSGRKGV